MTEQLRAYYAHPYGGLAANLKRARDRIAAFQARHPELIVEGPWIDLNDHDNERALGKCFVEIEARPVFVVFVPREGLSSPGCMRELRCAVRNGKRIIYDWEKETAETDSPSSVG